LFRTKLASSGRPLRYHSGVFQFRRFACILLGAWLAGSVFMDLVAVQNFRSVDRFLSDPSISAVQDVHTLGKAETRVLLRHMAGEQNRFYFEQWEWTELGLGLCFLLLLVFGSRPPKVSILLCLAMLAIVLSQRIALTPQIGKLGRALDFISPAPTDAQTKNFWLLHGIYSGVELVKIGLGLAIAGLMVFRRQPDRQMFARENELDELPVARRAK
jgi:hypothetical protein